MVAPATVLPMPSGITTSDFAAARASLEALQSWLIEDPLYRKVKITCKVLPESLERPVEEFDTPAGAQGWIDATGVWAASDPAAPLFPTLSLSYQDMSVSPIGDKPIHSDDKGD